MGFEGQEFLCSLPNRVVFCIQGFGVVLEELGARYSCKEFFNLSVRLSSNPWSDGNLELCHFRLARRFTCNNMRGCNGNYILYFCWEVGR